ncbi:MAG TPA: nucleoside deaminase [Acetobacteraceae bacterium]|jgi:tRNA(adenine34) deaminase|nr:nucleoside deaminase [Acetobacteraceae bacterium]
MSDDADHMRRALEQARQGDLQPGGNPIGCVIVRDGKILAEGRNEVDARHDPTAHAEIVTIRRACEALGVCDLRDATLYSTLQPCGMCTMASIWTKIGRIVYGAERHQVHAMYFEDRHLDTMDFIADAFKDDIALRGGVLGDECAAMYVPPDAKVPEEEQFNR